MMYITRRVLFNAAHNLYNPKWSKEENFAVFGPCSNIHGHNWELYATVKGEVNEETGFVMDLKDLSRELQTNIIDKVDHKYLNEDVDFLQGKLTSTENFVMAIWDIMAPILKEKYGATLHKLKLVETPNHYVEYYG